MQRAKTAPQPRVLTRFFAKLVRWITQPHPQKIEAERADGSVQLTPRVRQTFTAQTQAPAAMKADSCDDAVDKNGDSRNKRPST
jgi:hypothetical protein